MADVVYLVQPYVARGRGLVAQPARLYSDESSARRAGGTLARFRDGVVVLSQSFDPVTLRKDRPDTLAVHGVVPEGWGGTVRAA